MEQLAVFQYKIFHRPGKDHINADALSRLPAYSGEVVTSSVSYVEVEPSPQGVVLEQGEFLNQEIEGVEGGKNDLTRAQHSDPELSLMLKLKTLKGNRQEVMNAYPSLKKYALVWEQIEVQGWRSVRVLPPKTGLSAKSQVIIPQSIVPDILRLLHNITTGAHLGVQKLQEKVRGRFYWPGWYKDMKRWCQECFECTVHKEIGPVPRAPLIPSVTSRPYERVALDILGPLPETLLKNKYVLVVGDYFFKVDRSIPPPKPGSKDSS